MCTSTLDIIEVVWVQSRGHCEIITEENIGDFQLVMFWVLFLCPSFHVPPPVQSQHRLGAQLGQGATSAQLRGFAVHGRQTGRTSQHIRGLMRNSMARGNMFWPDKPWNTVCQPFLCPALLCLPSKPSWHFQSDLSGSGESLCGFAALPSHSASLSAPTKSWGFALNIQSLSWRRNWCSWSVSSTYLSTEIESIRDWKNKDSNTACRLAPPSDTPLCALARWEYLSGSNWWWGGKGIVGGKCESALVLTVQRPSWM